MCECGERERRDDDVRMVGGCQMKSHHLYMSQEVFHILSHESNASVILQTNSTYCVLAK